MKHWELFRYQSAILFWLFPVHIQPRIAIGCSYNALVSQNRHCNTFRITRMKCAQLDGSLGRNPWSLTPRVAKNTLHPYEVMTAIALSNLLFRKAGDPTFLLHFSNVPAEFGHFWEYIHLYTFIFCLWKPLLKTTSVHLIYNWIIIQQVNIPIFLAVRIWSSGKRVTCDLCVRRAYLVPVLP